MALALRRVLSSTSSYHPKVIATGGALFRHASPKEYHLKWDKWRAEDLPLLPEPRFRPRSGTTERIREYKSAIMRCDRVILAPPPDPAGLMDLQLLLDYAGFNGPVTIWDTTSLRDEDLVRAIAHPRKDVAHWVQVEKLRVHADWIIGLNGSRAMTLSRRVATAIPVGRVLSAMLSTFPVNETGLSRQTESGMDTAILQARILRGFDFPPEDALIQLARAWERGQITYPFITSGKITTLEQYPTAPSDPVYAAFHGSGSRENSPQHPLADWLESLRDVSPWVQDDALKLAARNIQLGSARGRMNHFTQLIRQGWVDPATMNLTPLGQTIYQKLPESLTDLGMTVLWTQALDRLSHGEKDEETELETRLLAFRSWAEKYVVDLVSLLGKG
ncbi:hypothetical protein H7F10_06960 [Acidithiobacillus sp. HP-6]|uniref:hypothetical protein n=1 Tax=unclassified Acidithiobacillus TaxID=2614800 RepID=UPI00187A3A61|nr:MULTISPECIES: hypothetical protein [unclassified Acidithiobacillus]MBE7562694.1 hypothetical protein [Acidithiobacillus sp. HP-6]MBE7570510.1 hypothetical protein [Acidithiobacillus sp. HP-2]